MTCGPRLLDLVRELDRRAPTGPNDTWRDLGVDSLDLLDLVVRCEDEFGVELPDAVVVRCAGPTALLDHLAG